MPLRLYGVVDPSTGIEFMVRANTDAEAQTVADELAIEIQNGGTLDVADFEDPVRMTGSLTATGFNSVGSVNGSVPLESFKVVNVFGVTGGVVTPDQNALDITGDLTLINWVDADFGHIGFGTFVDKLGVAGEQAFAFDFLNLTPANFLLLLSVDGTANDLIVSDDISTAELETISGGIWLRVTYDATAKEVRFYTSSASKSLPYQEIIWTQFGATKAAVNSSIHAGATDLTVFGSGVQGGVIGRHARSVGIASTDPDAAATWDCNPEESYSGFGPNFGSASLTQEIWTIEGDANFERVE